LYQNIDIRPDLLKLLKIWQGPVIDDTQCKKASLYAIIKHSDFKAQRWRLF